ncbi:phosphopantetheine-binding protein [Streptococcus pluranimalium]|uniref:D-alanine--poly(Phosphoribitol) ligase subunit 2 n=1 Tax=Streptococcus pluranimalium TaxID=82348 RepID=A0A345VKN4_9STRE|nr:phosphopantetheine-binding protein [Streptococcus pluranimalium]AXJ13286.1 D-alanine--poly(phosphoribitol) ligase subunit 2 [Streptococcus pluranimalium]
MINEVFSGIIEESILNGIINNPEEYQDISIKEIGVDSLATMEIVLRIEELCDIEINYDTFDIDDISTVGKILRLLEDNA